MMNGTRSRPLILILLTTFVGVAVFGQNSEENGEFDPEIVESVFRYQIVQCAENTSLTAFLLSVHGKDPSDEFMKRFANSSVTIKRRSVLARSQPTNEFIDKESGKFAALLSIDKLKFIEEGMAQVEGSCGYADWAGHGYKYSLVREKRRWLVKRADSTWVF